MAGQYELTTRSLIERYSGRIRPEFARGVRSAFSAGEWGLAAAELTSALVLDEIAVSNEDKSLFQELLAKIELSPDTPADIADQLRVEHL